MFHDIFDDLDKGGDNVVGFLRGGVFKGGG